MPSKTVLPIASMIRKGIDCHWSIFDHTQKVRIESSLSRDPKKPDLIELSQQDIVDIVEWAFPDLLYRSVTFPFPYACKVDVPLSIDAIQTILDNEIFTRFDIRLNEEYGEFFLLGFIGKTGYQLAQWRYEGELRSLRMMIDDVTPAMKQWKRRHLRMGILGIFLGCGALALNLSYWRLQSQGTDVSSLIRYTSYFFFALSGAAVALYWATYRRLQSATVITAIEHMEDDPVGVVFM